MCMYACMSMYICVCMYVCMYVCVHVYMYECVCMYEYVYMYECVCMNVTTYVCIGAVWTRTRLYRRAAMKSYTALSHSRQGGRWTLI